MKKFIIIAVLAVFALNNSLSANPVIVAELQKMEAAMEAKDNQIANLSAQVADLSAQTANLSAQIAAKDQEIAAKDSQIKTDLAEVVKVKFNQAMVDAKTSITKLTDDLLAKIKDIKK